LKKAKNAQRVGPIQINVSKTDPKKSKYTILVFRRRQTDRKEGQDFPANLFQFYVGGTRGCHTKSSSSTWQGSDHRIPFDAKGRRLRSCGRSGRS